MNAADPGKAILVRGAHVLCRALSDSEVLTIPSGAVLVVDGRIAEIGTFEMLSKRFPKVRVLGSAHHAVIPGLVDGHHHVGMTPLQMGTVDLPLEQWLTARLGGRDVDPRLDTLVSGFELIASGVTAVQHLDGMQPAPVRDWPARGRAVLDAYLELGMRVSYAMCVRDQHRLVYAADERFVADLPEPLARRANEYLAKTHFPLQSYESDYLVPLLEAFENAIADRLVRIWLAPINLERASDGLLTLNKDLARSHGIGIHLHMDETVYQKEFARLRFGMSSVRHLDKIGFLGPEVTLGHAVWTDDEDLDVIAHRGCSICHNASSNLRLRSGVAPLRAMLARNIPVSIGIDEAGLNDDRDMLQELRVVKHIHSDPGIFIQPVTSAVIFKMATQNGADAIGFGAETGSIEIGKRADLVLIDLERLSTPFLAPSISIVDALIYRAKAVDVMAVLIDGNIVYQNGEFTRVDRSAVLAQLQADFSQAYTAAELARKDLSESLFPFVRDFYRSMPLP
jgi:cytosine/adenosine deaminase-related metal-dependent hydrolase